MTLEMSVPWLTVVMPVHHGEKWIGATLASLATGDQTNLGGFLLAIIDGHEAQFMPTPHCDVSPFPHAA
jgi:hypothetical protein